MAYGPILWSHTINGSGLPNTKQFPEAVTQTFKLGAPLTLASGVLTAQADPIVATVAGVAAEEGKNLTTAGTTEPAISQQTVINMPLAKVTPVGARVLEGYSIIYLADGENVFSASLVTGVAWNVNLVGATRYALTLDGTSGRFYIDTADTGTDADHCVNILGLDESKTGTTVWVYFKFDSAARLF